MLERRNARPGSWRPWAYTGSPTYAWPYGECVVDPLGSLARGQHMKPEWTEDALSVSVREIGFERHGRRHLSI